jgi:hypothetical protein
MKVVWLPGVFVGVHLNKPTTKKSANKAKGLFARLAAFSPAYAA